MKIKLLFLFAFVLSPLTSYAYEQGAYCWSNYVTSFERCFDLDWGPGDPSVSIFFCVGNAADEYDGCKNPSYST